ncbi:MAG TPA: type II secretion system F family protein [Hyphomonadaceae bacterium]|nr:type II secretion system F family protein [Hyphomonadaceae bacterium]
MTYLPTLFLCGLAVLGFFLLVDGLIYIVANTGDRGESRLLRRLSLDKQAQAQHEYRLNKLAQDENSNRQLSANDYIDNLLAAASSKSPRSHVYISMVIFMATTMAFLLVFAGNFPLAPRIGIAVVVGVFLPIIQLKNQAAKRLSGINDQFPDTLELIVRSLRVGHPIGTALQTVAREIPAPTGPEFELIARQVTYGKTPAEAVTLFAQRVPTPDIRFFAVAIQIQHEGGGSLADILSGLSKIIRSRFQLFRKVKALTAEGRFSAYFLSGFPVVMILAMNVMQPGYYTKILDYEYFPQMAGMTFLLLLINVIAMRIMTKMEV